MANILAPFGFSPTGTVGGSTPNFRLSKRKVASTNATAIFFNDAVMPVTSTATGYIQQYATGSVPCCGVFRGCEYLSVSQGRRVWSPYWPGSDSAGDVDALVIDDPQATFLVQSGYASSAVLPANIDQNVSITASPTGNTLNGISGMTIGQPGTTSTYPFTIVSLVLDPSGSNGTDGTTAYNWAIVTFNNEIFRTGNTSIS